jgi:hypothetical protein
MGRNRGHFKRGKDPRRHRLTQAERPRGGQTTWRKFMDESPWMLSWLQRRIDATRRR